MPHKYIFISIFILLILCTFFRSSTSVIPGNNPLLSPIPRALQPIRRIQQKRKQRKDDARPYPELIRLTKKSGNNFIPEVSQLRPNDHPHLHDHLQTIHDPMINERLINDVPSIIRETFSHNVPAHKRPSDRLKNVKNLDILLTRGTQYKTSDEFANREMVSAAVSAPFTNQPLLPAIDVPKRINQPSVSVHKTPPKQPAPSFQFQQLQEAPPQKYVIYPKDHWNTSFRQPTAAPQNQQRPRKELPSAVLQKILSGQPSSSAASTKPQNSSTTMRMASKFGPSKMLPSAAAYPPTAMAEQHIKSSPKNNAPYHHAKEKRARNAGRRQASWTRKKVHWGDPLSVEIPDVHQQKRRTSALTEGRWRISRMGSQQLRPSPLQRDAPRLVPSPSSAILQPVPPTAAPASISAPSTAHQRTPTAPSEQRSYPRGPSQSHH